MCFYFPCPFFPLMQPPPSTRIGYRKTKLLYLFSLGKPAKEKLICSYTMVVLILSSSPPSFSRSPVPSLSLSRSLVSSLFLEPIKVQWKRKREKMKTKNNYSSSWWEQVESLQFKRGIAGECGLGAPNQYRFTLSSRITAIYQSAQKTVNPLHALHSGGGGRPVSSASNGCSSGHEWGSRRTFIRKL